MASSRIHPPAIEPARLSEESLRLLVDRVEDYAIYLLDTQGHVVSWNLGAQRIKGYEADEVLGTHFSRFFTAEDVADGRPSRQLEAASVHGRAEDEGWRLRKDGTRFWASVVVTAIRDDDGTLIGFGKVTRDLTARHQAEEARRARALEEGKALEAAENERRSKFLADASATLSDSLDYSQTLAKVARLAVPHFADWCTVSVLTARGFERVAIVHEDASKDSLVREYEKQFPPGNHRSSEFASVFATGEAVLIASISEDRLTALAQSAHHVRILRGLGVASCILVPLKSAGQTIGVLSFIRSEPGHEYNGADLILAQDLASRASLAVENSRLYTAEQKAREDAQRERDKLRRIFEQAPAAIAVLRGPDFRYDLANTPMNEMSGRRELTGKTIAEALPELVDSPLAGIVRQVFETGEPFIGKEVPLNAPRPDGTFHEIFINAMYLPLRDDRGRIDGVLCFAYEVTELVRSRLRAEQAERSTALVANSVPQVIWTRSADGQTRFVNDRWQEFSESQRAETFETELFRACHPEDERMLRRKWSESLSTGTPFEAEVRLRRLSDGLMRWHLMREVPIRDAGGSISLWVGSSTDIDEQKRSEEESQFMSEASSLLGHSLDSRATLKNLATLAVPRMADWCVIFLLDEDQGEPGLTRLVTAHTDPEKLKWAEEMAERYPSDPNATRGAPHVVRTGKPEFYPEVSDAMLVAVARDEEHLRMLRTVGFSSVMTVPLTSRGKTSGCISFVAAESRKRYTERDLAMAEDLANRAAMAVENARLYDEAQLAVKIRDEFLSVASHELRTPLTPLYVNVQSMQRMLQNPTGEPPAWSTFEHKLGVIARQVGRLERLVNGILDVSRITGGRLALDYEEVDLAAHAREVVERFRGQAENEGIQLSYEGADSAVGLWDKQRVDQVLVNLVSNALKFGERKPVVVQVSTDAQNATLQVIDQGIGIAPKDRERIFGRFERAVSLRHYGGLGLGLWLTRQIVEALHGTIGFESRLGGGSTFTVVLPRTQPVSGESNR